MRNRMERKVGFGSFSAVAGIFLLWLVGLAARLPAQNGPELPSWPEARRHFVAGPAEKAEPATADVPHLWRDSARGDGGEPAVVRFSDVAKEEAPPALGAPRAHLQGDSLLLQQIFDPAVPFSRPTEAISVDRPEVTRSSTGDVRTSFGGLSSTGWIPPDTVMAVGPSHVTEAVNSGFAVYSKAGSTLLGYTTFDTFFNPVKPAGWAGFFFDPRLLFSAETGKFAMLALGLDFTNVKSYFFIAVSQTANPTGTWWIWRIDSNFAGFTADAWLDFAGLGADTWGLYVTGNYFLWAGGFKYSTIISLNPAMYTGGTANGWQFVNLQWPSASLAFSPQPALPLSIAGGAETFFVNSWSGFGSQLLLWKLTGDRTNNPTLVRSAVNVSSYSAIGQNIDQPGSATHIDGGDARVGNAFYSQRRVYTSLTNDTNANATSAGVLAAKLNVDTNLSEWNTTVDGGAGWYYFYPAVAIGDASSTSPSISIFLSWTHPSSTQFASAAVKTYLGPPTNLQGPFPNLAGGLASYVALDNNNRNRWGDYTGAGFDFSNSTVWGAVEYAGTGNSWRTRIAELQTPIFADGFESGTTAAWQ